MSDNISEIARQAAEVGDSWAIKAGVFMNILPVYDPGRFFEELSQMPMRVSQEAIRSVIREFMGLNAWYEELGIEYRSKELPF